MISDTFRDNNGAAAIVISSKHHGDKCSTMVTGDKFSTTMRGAHHGLRLGVKECRKLADLSGLGRLLADSLQ